MSDESNDKKDGGQLLRLTVRQALQPQYVVEQTRGTSHFLDPQTGGSAAQQSGGAEQKEGNKNKDGDEETLPSLVSDVLREAKNRHLTAGFGSVSSKKGDNIHETALRKLSRELSAIGLMADTSFLSLTNKRAIILDKIVDSYQREFRLKGTASQIKKELDDQSHPLLKVSVASGVFMMLHLLKDASRSNIPLCLQILTFIKSQLAGVEPCELESTSKLPIPAISEDAFASVHLTLNSMALDESVSPLIRSRCLELLLMISVTRGTLHTLTSVMYALLFKFTPEHTLECRSSIVRLRKMRREMRLDLPSAKNQTMKASVISALGHHNAMATDGKYLYIHSSKGISKIGTGLHNTSPGFVMAQIREYRSGEQASLAVVNDKLYYRSGNIAPASLIVLDLESLTEIGHVLIDGSGTFETTDNSEIAQVFGIMEDRYDRGDDLDADEASKSEETEEVDSVTSLRRQMRTISDRMDELEQLGLYDTDEMYELEEQYDELVDLLGGDFDPDDADLAELDKPDEDEKKKKEQIPTFNPIIGDGRFLYAVIPVKPAKTAGSSADSDSTDDSTDADGSSGGGTSGSTSTSLTSSSTPASETVAGSGDGDSDENSDEEKEKKERIPFVNLRVNAFDPEKGLEYCRSVDLKRAELKNEDSVLDFNATDADGNPVNPMSSNSGGRGFSKRRRGGQKNDSCVTLGCPKHLRWQGSLTMECWVKFDQKNPPRKVSQNLFHHGDATYRTYVYVSNQAVYAGAATVNGGSSGYANTSLDWNVWNHIACTYDTSDCTWRVYCNGVLSNNQVNPGAAACGPQANSADWVVGSVSTRPFYGKMMDVRIWNEARTEEQIRKGMKARYEQLVVHDSLRGWWPLNEGIGLSVRDISRFANDGFMNKCTWINGEDRPYQLRVTLDDKEQDLQRFAPTVCAKSTFYTNGEALVICHPRDTYMDKENVGGVAQVFSMETGVLQDEVEYAYFDQIESATFVKSGAQMWLYCKPFDGDASLHNMAPPASISKWRQDRMKSDESIDMSKPSPKRLIDDFGLEGVDFFPEKPEDQAASLSDDTSDEKTGDADIIAKALAVPVEPLSPDLGSTCILANMLIKLDADCLSLRSVDSTDSIPMGLSIPFGVDLTYATFVNLLSIVEKLSEEFYSESTEVFDETKSKLEEVRMLTMLVCLRLLRTNILHMVSWNVNSNSCGFTEKQKDETGQIVIGELTVRQRYVTLLNQLIFGRPTRPLSKAIEDMVHEEVAECLSIGLAVFYQDPIDRVGILFDHVNACLAVDTPNPLRLLLASRYFASLTLPHNLIGLVPALISLVKKGDKSELFERSALLERVLDLVYSSARKQMICFLDNPDSVNSSGQSAEESSAAASSSNGDGTGPSDLMSTLRHFLSRMEICLFDSDVGAAERPVYVKYALPYALKLMDLSSELLELSIAKKSSLKLFEQATMVLIFTEKFGELLPPLLNSLWAMYFTPEVSSQILPRVNRLILALDAFMSDLPDVQKSENDFVNGRYERLVVQRSADCESAHPCARGSTEKYVSIPGAKSLKLTIDTKSFDSSSPGSSLALYRKRNQREPIDGANFISVPTKPVHISGDSVWIHYNSGYSSNCWGFKVTVSATIEETRNEIPWILDLYKNTCLLASKCVGCFIRATPEKTLKLSAENYDLLNSDLLYQGLEYSKECDVSEREKLSFLPQLKKADKSLIDPSLDFDLRDSAVKEVDYIQLAEQLVPLMKKVPVTKLPTPADVSKHVESAIVHTFAVVIKHNLLVQTATEFIEKCNSSTDGSPKVPEGLARCWKTTQKLRNWLVGKNQKVYAQRTEEMQKKLKELEEKRKKSKKKKRAGKRNKGRQDESSSAALAGVIGSTQVMIEESKEAVIDGGGASVAGAGGSRGGRGRGGSSSGGPHGPDEFKMIDPTRPMDAQSGGQRGGGGPGGPPGGRRGGRRQSGGAGPTHDPLPGAPGSEDGSGKKKGKGKGKDKKKSPEQLKKEQMMREQGLMPEDGGGSPKKGKGKGKDKKKSPEQLKKEAAATAMGLDTGASAMGGGPSESAMMSSAMDTIPMGSASSLASSSTLMSADSGATLSSAATDSKGASASSASLSTLMRSKKFEVDKNALWQEICDEVVKRCLFLLQVLAVPPRADSVVPSPAGLTRQRSAERTGDAASTAALTAWHSTKERVGLREATTEQRYSIIWRLVLSFIDEEKVDLELFAERIEQDRWRARMRAFGLRCLTGLLLTSNFSIAKREILHFLIPSLYESNTGAFTGLSVNFFSGLKSIGYGLRRDLLAAMTSLYQKLIAWLNDPKQTGTHLLQATTYAFALDYRREEFDLLVSLGVFDSLKVLLAEATLSGVKDSTASSSEYEAKSAASLTASPPSVSSSVKGTTGDVSITAQSSKAYQTAAWSLLEMLTTRIQAFKQDSLSGPDTTLDGYLDTVFSILLDQLQLISKLPESEAGLFVPHLPPTSIMSFGKQIQAEGPSAMVSQKVATVSQFGFDAAVGNDAVDEEDEEDQNPSVLSDGSATSASEEAFHIRVLSLVESLCSQGGSSMADTVVDDAIKLFTSSAAMSALFRLLWGGSPRTRVVVLRILRHVLSSKVSPELSLLDSCVAETTVNYKLFIPKILSEIGTSVLAPVFSSLFTPSANCTVAMKKLLTDLKLSKIYATDFVLVFAELISLLRHLALSKPEWATAISKEVSKSMAGLSDFLKRAYSEKHSSESLIDDDTFVLFGALSVFGGYADNVRVGSRVFYLPEGVTAIVTARKLASDFVSLVREGEGSVANKVHLNEVIALGDVAFDADLYFTLVDKDVILSGLLDVLKQPLLLDEDPTRDDTEDGANTNSKDNSDDSDIFLTSDDKGLPMFKLRISGKDVMCSKLQSVCSSVLCSILQSKNWLATFVEKFGKSGVQSLTSVAFAMTHQTCALPTAVLNDRSLILMNECMRRVRDTLPVDVTISRDEVLKLSIHQPKIEFLCEFTCLGRKLKQHTQGVSGLSEATRGSIGSELVYLRLDEKITAEKVEGKIVLIDTYGSFKKRMAKLQSKGAAACILGLHSTEAKNEGLHVKSDEEAKDDSTSTDIVDLAAQSVASSGFNFGGNLAQDPFSGFDRYSSSNRLSNWDRGGDFFQSIQIQSSTAAFASLSSALGAADGGTGSGSGPSGPAEMKRAESEEEADADTIDDQIKQLYVVAVDDETSEILRGLLSMKQAEHPAKIHKRMMVEQLMAKGHSRELALRALKKDQNITIDAANTWIEENLEWLTQTLDEDLKAFKGRIKVELADDKLPPLMSNDEIISDKLALTNEWDLVNRWAPFDLNALHSMATTNSGLTQASKRDSSSEYDSFEPTSSDHDWYNGVFFKPTHAILHELLRIQHSLRIHFCRRIFLSLFMNCGLSESTSGIVPLVKLMDKWELERSLHIILSVRPFPALSVDAMAGLQTPDVTGRLVQCLQSDSTFYLDTLQRSTQGILRNVCHGAWLNDDPEVLESKRKIIVAPVHGRYGQNNNGVAVIPNHVSWGQSARRLKVIMKSDPTLSSLGTAYVTLYKDAAMTQILGRYTMNAFDQQTHVHVVDSGEFWYTVLSSSWYSGCPPANVSITVLDLSNEFIIRESDALNGTIYSAIVFINALLKAGAPQLGSVCLQLLRALEFAPDQQSAQAIARIATSMFNAWDSVPLDSENEADAGLLESLAEAVDELEYCHEALRTNTLVSWASGSRPGPHIQTLLELLLAARTALPPAKKSRAERLAERKAAKKKAAEEESGSTPAPSAASAAAVADASDPSATMSDSVVMVSDSDLQVSTPVSAAVDADASVIPEFAVLGESKADDTQADDQAPPPPESSSEPVKKSTIVLTEKMKNTYSKYREGPTECSCISLMWEKKQTSKRLSVHRDSHNRYMIDDFVGDVCVRDGGKWYWEVKFVGQVSYACVGWITRNYRKRSNSGISSDSTGDSWCLYGPNTLFYHRSRSHRPFSGGGMEDGGGFVQPNWNSGSLIVGCKLDLDDGTMEFTFDGQSGGTAFSGFDAKEGLYPCISLNQNTYCSVNFGGEEFEYFPKNGFCPLEHHSITSSSWLTRYRMANEMTRHLTKREVFSEEITRAALKTEASLEYSHNLRFEVVKTNAHGGTRLDQLLKDDGLSWSSTKPADTNITFKVSGYDDVDFVLRSVSIRSSSSSQNCAGMVFIGNSDPDFDSFDWCKHFTKQQFDQFESRRASGAIRKPHEPVAFFSMSGSTGHVRLKPPLRGKYLTLKIQARSGQTHLQLEYVKFDCIHGGHPLSSLIGSDEATIKRKEMIDAFRKLINNDSEKWSLPMDEQLTELSQIVSNRLGVDVMSLDSVMLNPSKDDYSRFKRLEVWGNDEALQSRFAVIKHLNKLVTPLLHYIDITLYQGSQSKAASGSSDDSSKSEEMRVDQLFRHFPSAYDEALIQAQSVKEFSFKALKEEEEKKKDSAELSKVKSLLEGHTTLSSQVHILKGCYFMSTKKSVFDTLLMGDSSSSSSTRAGSGSRPRVTINRIRAARAKELAKINSRLDPDGLKSVFGQLFNQLKDVRYSSLRGTSGEQLWSVSFSGEGSIDVGGPYRECLTMAVNDLQSDATPLFVLCPNGRNSVGLNREKWMISPSKTSSLHLSMYEFVGVLMGIALRTKQTMSFDLPSIVWKQILGEQVDISDLEGIDKLCVQALNEMEKIKPEHFEFIVYETFTTQLSDGTECELKEDGRNISVNKDNFGEFVSLIIKKRLNESSRQIKAIQKGLNSIVPIRMLSLFSWFDLETLVCGNPNFDVEVFRRHTVYQGGLSHSTPVVKFFWKTMHSFTQEERGLFLRFVWGRNRLPATESDWEGIQFTIKGLAVSPDSLPIAHTCFFSFDLPPYVSFEQCRDKLRFAINNCQAIDIDFNPNSSSLQAWVDDY